MCTCCSNHVWESRIHPSDDRVEFVSPQLPKAIDRLELTNLKVGESTVDLYLWRDGGHDLGVEVLRKEGNAEVYVRN